MLASGVWIGGFIAITIVSATSKKSLGPRERVNLFRGLGRGYLKVAVISFVVVVVPGAVLLSFRPWDGYSLAIVLLAAVLVIDTGLAVRQARQLTRIRRAQAETHAETQAGAPIAGEEVAGKAAAARVLRTGIGLLSLAIFVVVVAMP